ncbi:uncharacterized protein LOC106662119 [Cimex lectularius]|uniref:Chitin-binding type-2 domain-containing protein n=1 Tax=Cimex lectularius TaxID=79782 RepID=A0A8I6RA54_CIMLE|nr:uncharacterized protein LOC106662119 [Cimex lectularius]
MSKIIFIALLSVAGVLSLDECEHVGMYPGPSKKEFTVCSEVHGTLLKSVHSCCNETVFSPSQKKCVLPGLGVSVYSQMSTDDAVKLECLKPGLQCADCNTLQVCIEYVGYDRAVEVNPVLNITCNLDEVCQFKKGCVKLTEGGFCNLKPFECTDLGVFPDPFDCRKYYFCAKDQKREQVLTLPFLCPEEGGSFDVDSGNCGFPLDSEACKNKPLPFCEKELQMGAVGQGNVYYMCQKNEDGLLGPSMYRCPYGKKFDKDSYSCL